MAVEVNSTRKAVEIAWDSMGGETEPAPPETFPPYPVDPDYGIDVDSPYPDQGLPGEQPHPDQGLPGEQPRPDNTLPGEQPHPDQGLPGEQPHPSHPIYLPPYIDNSLPGEAAQKLKEFLTGNLPPFEHPAPVSGKGGKQIAVQVFAQGQDGDWSNTAVMPNDGLAVLSYPKDFKGESYVEVRSLDGAVIDSGTITVK